MSLPPTYFEFIRSVHPYVITYAEQDVALLRSQDGAPKVINSIDSFPSHFNECVAALDEGFVEHAATRVGMSSEAFERILGSEPSVGGLPAWKTDPRTGYANALGAVNLEYHSVLNFLLAGQKTFYVGDHLAERLANTEVNLSASMVHLPFSCCQIVFTSPTVIAAAHRVRGEVAKWSQDLDRSAPVSVFASILPAPGGLQGRKLVLCVCHGKLPGRAYLMMKRELFLGEDWSLERALRTDWETLTPDDVGVGLILDLGTHVVDLEAGDDVFYTDGLHFYRIVLNSILYLASVSPELTPRESPRRDIERQASAIQSEGKRRKLLQTRNRFSDLDFIELGASAGPIILKPDDGEAPFRAPTEPVGKVRVRYLVRGHWRNQAHGEGRTERKLLWIEPHFRGPDMAQTINRPYTAY